MNTNSKIIFVIIFINIIFLSSCNTQNNPPDQFSLVQNFKKDKTYRFNIIRQKIDSKNPLSAKAFSLTDVQMNLAEDKGDIKSCEWIYGKTKSIYSENNKEIPLDEEWKKLINIYEGIKIKFTINKDGKLLELTNFNECKKQLEESSLKIYYNKHTKINNDDITILKNTLQTTYDTPEKLIDSYFPEISIYFAYFGTIFNNDSIIKSEYLSTNPWGEERFPTIQKIRVVKTEGNVAYIEGIGTIDQASFSRIMKESFKKIATNAGREFNENEISNAQISSSFTYQYELDKKKLKSAEQKKYVSVEKISVNDLTKIILLDN